MREITDLLTNPHSAVTLDRAALDIAQFEYPDLDPEPWIQRWIRLLRRSERGGPFGTGREFIESDE